jgi:glycogen phosphorylase
MGQDNEAVALQSSASGSPASPDLLEQYGCGPIRFSGHNDALYERHLLFDDVIDPLAAAARECFETAARSVRDVLSQRSVRTERTYNHPNPKRIYYLSMEFLIGRSLANNVTILSARAGNFSVTAAPVENRRTR